VANAKPTEAAVAAMSQAAVSQAQVPVANALPTEAAVVAMSQAAVS
jgi:hypothetical protein